MTARAGMTLMEVVVALTVAGTALAAGYGALATLVDRGDSAEEVAEAAVHDAVLRQTLAEWLAATRVSGATGAPSFEGLDGDHEDVPDDVVIFLTAARTPVQARETIVMLYIDRDDATPERGLVAALAAWHGVAVSTNPPLPAATAFTTGSTPNARTACFLHLHRGRNPRNQEWSRAWSRSSAAPVASRTSRHPTRRVRRAASF